jgi:hypothetical protein
VAKVAMANYRNGFYFKAAPALTCPRNDFVISILEGLNKSIRIILEACLFN